MSFWSGQTKLSVISGCPYEAGVCMKQVPVERGSTVLIYSVETLTPFLSGNHFTCSSRLYSSTQKSLLIVPVHVVFSYSVHECYKQMAWMSTCPLMKGIKNKPTIVYYS